MSDMVAISEFEAKVLDAYMAGGTREQIVKRSGVSRDAVMHAMKRLKSKGIVDRVFNNQRYRLTGVPYTVKAARSYPKELYSPIETDHISMSDYEKKWMLENYKSHKRTQAAKALGRSRSDICMMASMLGLDFEGRWNRAKNNKGRSA